jgi:aspartyl-tRNA(Asn)/glutamyl-tRNA(Gln) amidotransferase subunit A
MRHQPTSRSLTILGAFNRALEVFREAGATLVDIELPHASHAVPTYYLVAPAEASSNLARYDGIRFGARSTHNEASDESDSSALSLMYNRTRKLGFGPEVKRRIMLGTYALSAGYYDAYYLKAQQVRNLIRHDYDLVFENERGPHVHVIALPTTPTPAFQLGEHSENPLAMYLRDVFTVSANLTGLPAISIPTGFTEKRLPIGLQLVGRAFDEETLLRVGDAYERRTPWNKQSPKGVDPKQQVGQQATQDN